MQTKDNINKIATISARRRQAGQSLVGLLVAVGMCGVVGLIIAGMTRQLEAIARTEDLLETRRELLEKYQRILDDKKAIEATLAHPPNAGLANYRLGQGGAVLNDIVPLAVLDGRGNVQVPKTGSLLDRRGRPTTASKAYFKVSATWQARQQRSYSTKVDVEYLRGDRKDIIIGKIANREVEIYEGERETECVTMDARTMSIPTAVAPPEGSSGHWRHPAGYAGFEADGIHRVYTHYHTMTNTCPTGYVISSLVPDFGCNGRQTEAYAISPTVARCQVVTGPVSPDPASGCDKDEDVWSYCNIICCKPFQ